MTVLTTFEDFHRLGKKIYIDVNQRVERTLNESHQFFGHMISRANQDLGHKTKKLELGSWAILNGSFGKEV